MITELKEKNKYCNDTYGKVITIVMTEDFETDAEYSKIANYSLKLFKGQEYDIEIAKFDSHDNGDLAVSLFLVNNDTNKNNVEFTTSRKDFEFHEVQEKVFTFRFDILD